MVTGRSQWTSLSGVAFQSRERDNTSQGEAGDRYITFRGLLLGCAMCVLIGVGVPYTTMVM